jgi:peptidoglycan/LPS O-acetylase OafA/YrhL
LDEGDFRGRQLGNISNFPIIRHFIVLVCLAPRIVSSLNSIGIRTDLPLQWLTIVTVTAICLVLADLGERWIEVPCIRLGKNLTLLLDRHAAVRKFKI